MFTMVATVLHLGNITFEEDDKDAAYIQDMAPINVIAVSILVVFVLIKALTV